MKAIQSRHLPKKVTIMIFALLALLPMAVISSGYEEMPANPVKTQDEISYLRTLWGDLTLSELGSIPYDELTDAQTRYRIVQFDDVIHPDLLEGLRNAGAVPLEYFPDHAIVVDLDGADPADISDLEGVIGTQPYRPALKFHPYLLSEVSDDILGTEGSVLIDSFTFDPEMYMDLAPLGAWVDQVSMTRYEVGLPITSFIGLISRENVKWVEKRPDLLLDNDVADSIIDVDLVRSSLGYDGTGQIVAVCDSGIDTGVDDPEVDGDIHSDLDNRVTIFNWAGSSADDAIGHGTHVSGSVLGDGTSSGGNIQGMAPNASLVFQGIGTDAGGLSTPGNLSLLFTQAYNNGARIHTNSWGSSGYNGVYTTSSRDADWSMFYYPELLILFSAGNSGVDNSPQNGKIDSDSISPPATAKSIVTVGASESVRSTGGLQYSWGAAWPSDFPQNPINGDAISDDEDGLAAFSSRGPTDDGRLKPDVVAPGTNILSTRSSVSSTTGWGTYSNSRYLYMGGTSMSCPITAGTSALIREYYNRTHGIDDPLGSLIKATLINGAVDLTPGQYGADPTTREVNRRPDNDQGWGRIDLKRSIDPTGNNIAYLEERNGLVTGENVTRGFRVDSTDELRLTLAWSDYPGNPASSKQLVNDLDLILTAPNGTVYHGNDLTYPYDDTRDDTNPVEGISINNPSPGWWLVEVLAYNIPSGPQHFSLVGSGDMTGFVDDMVLFDREYYNVNGDTITVELRMRSLNGHGTATVNLSSTAETTSRSLTLTEVEPSIFRATLTTSSFLSDPEHIMVSHNSILDLNFTDPVLGGFHEDTATAKVPQRVELVRSDENHLTYSYSDTIHLYGEGDPGASAYWTLNNTSIGWKRLFDDGSPPDTVPLDGEFYSSWTVDSEFDVIEDVVVRVDDPFLGPLYHSLFHISINTSLPKIPEDLTAEPIPEGNGVLLEWKRTAEPDISHYEVFINSTDVVEPDESSWDRVQTTLSHINHTTVRGLSDDVDYHFRIASVNDSGVRSSLSLWTLGTPHDSFAPIINPAKTPYTLAGNTSLLFNADVDLTHLELQYYDDSDGDGLANDNNTFLFAANSTGPEVRWDTRNISGGPGNLKYMILRFRGEDEVPNLSPWYYMPGYSVDNIGPLEVSLNGLPARITNISHYDIYGFTEPLSSIEIWVNSDLQSTANAGSSGVFDIPLDLSEGKNLVEIKVYDRHGAGPTVETREFTLDTSAPTASIEGFTGPKPSFEIGNLAHMFNSTSTDEGSDPEYGIINTTWRLTDPLSITRTYWTGTSLLVNLMEVGDHVISLSVRDAAGNKDSITHNFTVYDLSEPNVVITGPYVVDEDTLVEYSGHDTTDNDPTLRDRRKGTFEWTFTGPFGFVSTSLKEDTTVIFPEPGMYTASLWVTDPSGNRGTSVISIEVMDISPPVGDIKGPSSGDRGFCFTYRADVIDNDPDFSDDASYLWTLIYEDDHTLSAVNSSEKTFEHMFDISGNYTLILSVTDGSGNVLLREFSIMIRPYQAVRSDTSVDEGEKIPYTIMLIIGVILIIVLVGLFIAVKAREGVVLSDDEWEDDDEDIEDWEYEDLED